MIRKIIRTLTATCWNVGFIDFESHDSVLLPRRWRNISWLHHKYKDRWFADPFILSSDDNWLEVLVEEWVDDERKGRISKLEIEKRGKEYYLKKIVPLLSLDTHLSFPFIIRKNAQVFVMPENCASGKLTRYVYNRQEEKLVRDSSWQEVNAPMTDAILMPSDLTGGTELLLSTEFTMGTGPSGKKLGVYKRRQGNQFARVGEIDFSDKSARNAGAIFRVGGQWIRPAQDCNKRYGAKLVFQQISPNGDTFSFNELFRVSPKSNKWNLGIHTFNLSENQKVAVVDGYRYRTPIIGRIFAWLKIGKFLASIQRSLQKK